METYAARLGDRVKDRVSGFTGVVTSLHRYLQGCDRMTVQPPTGGDGKLLEASSFDAPDLEVIDAQLVPYHDRRDKSYTGDVELADKVRDRVSKFEGVAVARHIYLNGCDRISVQPIVDKKDTALPDSKAFDAPQLEVIKREYIKYETSTEERRRIGGPSKFMPEMKESSGRRVH